MQGYRTLDRPLQRAPNELLLMWGFFLSKTKEVTPCLWLKYISKYITMQCYLAFRAVAPLVAPFLNAFFSYWLVSSYPLQLLH